MNHNFRDIIVALTTALFVVAAAYLFGLPQAKAGTLDQGPHILVVMSPGLHKAKAVEIFPDRDSCLAARADLATHFNDEGGWLVTCVPGRVA